LRGRRLWHNRRDGSRRKGSQPRRRVEHRQDLPVQISIRVPLIDDFRARKLHGTELRESRSTLPLKQVGVFKIRPGEDRFVVTDNIHPNRFEWSE